MRGAGLAMSGCAEGAGARFKGLVGAIATSMIGCRANFAVCLKLDRALVLPYILQEAERRLTSAKSIDTTLLLVTQGPKLALPGQPDAKVLCRFAR